MIILSSIPFLLLVNAFTFSILRFARTQIYSQIEQTTITLNSTIESLLDSSIRSYLFSKIEAGRDIIRLRISETSGTESSKQVAADRIFEDLAALRVGNTGYFYAVDSGGKVVYHPDPNFLGTDLSRDKPVDRQIIQREGYLEYEWQNTYESEIRKKALYMTYIPELDWILTATSYRDEFTGMLDTESLKDAVKNIRIGRSGYSYIIGTDNTIVAHPLYPEGNAEVLAAPEAFRDLIAGLSDLKEGYTRYMWRDSEDDKLRRKVVYGKYVDDFEWIIGTALYEYEINRPITMMLIAGLVLTAAISVLLYYFTRKISRTIEQPIALLHRTLNEAIIGNLGARTEPSGPVEVFELGVNLNIFIENLDQRTTELKNLLAEKDILIQEIQHRVKNNLQIIISLLNLQAETADDSAAHRMLHDIINRVSVMALVYDHMMHTESDFMNDRLMIPGFIENYITSIMTSFTFDYERLKIRTDIAPLFLSRNAAISLGLILNELLNHFFKMFTGNDSPAEVEISIKTDDLNRIVLTMVDSLGSLSPETWDADDDRISFILVKILVQQLGGARTVKDRPPDFLELIFPGNL